MSAEIIPGGEPVQEPDVVGPGSLAIERVLGPHPDAALPEFRINVPPIPVGEEEPAVAGKSNEPMPDIADVPPSRVMFPIRGGGGLPGWPTPEELQRSRGTSNRPGLGTNYPY